ncbi:unnamed protein product [Rhizophagus irregularis]|nr:unnamed protein product [Rhizophagus irregularis]
MNSKDTVQYQHEYPPVRFKLLRSAFEPCCSKPPISDDLADSVRVSTPERSKNTQSYDLADLARVSTPVRNFNRNYSLILYDYNHANESYRQRIKPRYEREINNESYPQSQKLSLGRCMECRKLFTGKKWCRPSKGGNSNVYKAIWKQGPITYWDTNTHNWERFGRHEVVLKVIEKSQENLDVFINEVGTIGFNFF